MRQSLENPSAIIMKTDEESAVFIFISVAWNVLESNFWISLSSTHELPKHTTLWSLCSSYILFTTFFCLLWSCLSPSDTHLVSGTAEICAHFQCIIFFFPTQFLQSRNDQHYITIWNKCTFCKRQSHELSWLFSPSSSMRISWLENSLSEEFISSRRSSPSRKLFKSCRVKLIRWSVMRSWEKL